MPPPAESPSTPALEKCRSVYGVETDVAVTDDPGRERFEITLGGELAGVTQYRRRPGLIAFVHTEVDPRFEGRGLGGRLIGAALDASGAEGLAVLPFCPFVSAYIERHPEYAELVPEAFRPKFGLHSA
jgi:predicted GNAT family acetyltransferase